MTNGWPAARGCPPGQPNAALQPEIREGFSAPHRLPRRNSVQCPDDKCMPCAKVSEPVPSHYRQYLPATREPDERKLAWSFSFPLVESVRQDQAPAFPERFAEGGLGGHRLAPGIDHAVADGGICRPGRHEVPPEGLELAGPGLPVLDHRRDLLPWDDVATGRRLRPVGEVEELADPSCFAKT